MKILILTKDGAVPGELVKYGNVDVRSVDDGLGEVKDYDFIGVLGSDRFILNTLHRLAGVDKPIITMGYGAGYLNTVDIGEFGHLLDRLRKGDFSIERIPTLSMDHGYVAINDIVIAPAKSATLMEYTLMINDEFIWRDNADGLIISTPIGSTAYALSAGGVLLYGGLEAFEIVPINSTNIARVPIVAPCSSRIVVMDLVSKARIEAIIDGSIRVPVATNKVTIVNGPSINIVKLSNATALDRYRRIIESIVSELPPSAKLILKVLEYEGALTPKEIVERTMMPQRTVRAALKILVKKGLVNRFMVPRGGSRTIVYSLTNGTKVSIK